MLSYGYSSSGSRRTAARLSIEVRVCRGGRRPVPAGRRPGSRLRPYCCQQRQGSRMDEGLGTAVSGWTRVSSSARNRLGLSEGGEVAGVLDQRQPLGRRLDLLEVLLGQGGQGDHVALALEQEEGDLEAGAQPPGVVGHELGEHLGGGPLEP